MYITRPTRLMRSVFSSALWRVNTNEKKIFLTFDDGPIPEITPWVLNTLNKFNAKATFFCVGENIHKHPLLYREIITQGHTTGNHTYNHLDGWKSKFKKYYENILKCDQISNNCRTNNHTIKLDQKPLFRPPYGRMSLSQYLKLKSEYSIVMWDLLSGDFDRTISMEECLQNVLAKTRKGSIVVFHDSIKAKINLQYTLPKMLEIFSKEGFAFESI